MKRVVGFVLVLVGVVGLVGCAVGVGYTWWFSNKYLGQAAETVKAAKTLLTSADQRIDRLSTRVGDARSQLVSLEKAAGAVAAKGPAADPADKAKVQNLLATLSSKIEWTEDLAAILRATVRPGAELMTSFAETPPDMAEKVKAVEDAAEKTVKNLEGVRGQIADAGKDENVEQTAKNISALASAVQTALTEVTDSVTKIDAFLERGRTELNALEKSIDGWKKYGPILVTVLLVWVALGQFCLFAWGWSWLMGPGTKEA